MIILTMLVVAIIVVAAIDLAATTWGNQKIKTENLDRPDLIEMEEKT